MHHPFSWCFQEGGKAFTWNAWGAGSVLNHFLAIQAKGPQSERTLSILHRMVPKNIKSHLASQSAVIISPFKMLTHLPHCYSETQMYLSPRSWGLWRARLKVYPVPRSGRAILSLLTRPRGNGAACISKASKMLRKLWLQRKLDKQGHCHVRRGAEVRNDGNFSSSRRGEGKIFEVLESSPRSLCLITLSFGSGNERDPANVFWWLRFLVEKAGMGTGWGCVAPAQLCKAPPLIFSCSLYPP